MAPPIRLDQLSARQERRRGTLRRCAFLSDMLAPGVRLADSPSRLRERNAVVKSVEIQRENRDLPIGEALSEGKAGASPSDRTGMLLHPRRSGSAHRSRPFASGPLRRLQRAERSADTSRGLLQTPGRSWASTFRSALWVHTGIPTVSYCSVAPPLTDDGREPHPSESARQRLHELSAYLRRVIWRINGGGDLWMCLFDTDVVKRDPVERTAPSLRPLKIP